MAYEKQIWNQYDALKTEEENIENGAVVTDNRMNHIEEGIEAHTTDFKNPHKVTAAQVGLGNVPNYAAATEDEALAGESNDTIMTPNLTKAAAKSYVTKEDVGLSNVTNDEQATKTDFNAHTANKSNPHSVTASQVGAYSKTETDSKLALKANDSEVVHNTGDETIAGKKTFTGDMSVSNLVVTGAISTVNDIPLTKVTNWNSGWSGNAYYKVRNGQVTLVFQGVTAPALSSSGSVPFAIPGLTFSLRCINTAGYIIVSGTNYKTKVDFNNSTIVISESGGTPLGSGGILWLTITQEII